VGAERVEEERVGERRGKGRDTRRKGVVKFFT
jgi:hypothetical protein